MIQLGAPDRRRAAVDRRGDRLVAVAAIVLALAFMLAAVLVVILPRGDQSSVWLPVHLALAGGATTAIAGVMPFFSAAISASAPVDARLRWASLTTIAMGTAAITLGFTVGPMTLASFGGVAFIAGVALVGHATLAPLRSGLGPRGGIVAGGYAAAVGMVLAGAALPTLYLLGWGPVVIAWSALKPAHAWLNLVGFISLIIATTLLHFFPTVVGARIQRVPAAYATTIGLALGSALVAVGFAAGSDIVTRLGAGLVAVGAVALAVYVLMVWRTRGRWRRDLAWHRFAMGGLISAIVWFEVGMLFATLRLLFDGATPAAVDVAILAGPLITGWMGLSVLASATHLMPAVGPGDRDAHTRQRAILGRAATLRLGAANLGVAALSIGLALSWRVLIVPGLALLAVSLAGTALLLFASAGIGLRTVRSASA